MSERREGRLLFFGEQRMCACEKRARVRMRGMGGAKGDTPRARALCEPRRVASASVLVVFGCCRSRTRPAPAPLVCSPAHRSHTTRTNHAAAARLQTRADKRGERSERDEARRGERGERAERRAALKHFV